MSDELHLSAFQVALAACLLLVNGLVSILLKLRMERSLLIAGVRTVVQLTLIGFVLEWVFQLNRWYAVIGLAMVMTVIAGATAAGRSHRYYTGMWMNTLVSIWTGSWLVTAYALTILLPDAAHWYRPQYLIPLLGMVLGNTLNGISLGLNTLTENLASHRGEVESLLALGATRWESAREPVREAVKTGMIPIVNSMLIVGLVSLPGMMTGQILAGTSPLEAVKYQIVIMFLIASGTAMGTVGVVILSYRRLFNARHQFLHEQIRTRSTS
ncbi:MAG: iron export ABC transporter permease subunit FetB [Planctomycetaceae bacterium]